MTCGNCERHVREALLAVPGVDSAVVDLASGRATIVGTADPASLAAAIVGAGYAVKAD